jgi:hypothetical protein
MFWNFCLAIVEIKREASNLISLLICMSNLRIPHVTVIRRAVECNEFSPFRVLPSVEDHNLSRHSPAFFCITARLAGRWQRWVRTGKAQEEHKFSAFVAESRHGADLH